MPSEREIQWAARAIEDLQLSPGRFDRHIYRVIASTALKAAELVRSGTITVEEGRRMYDDWKP